MYMLNRSQFDTACKAFIAKYSLPFDQPSETNVLRGWSWNEHSSVPGFGYMSRATVISRRSESEPTLLSHESELDCLDDDATATRSHGSCESLTHCQYVVYSSTFRVPAFYFTIHDPNGSPLALTDVVRTSLFRPLTLEGTEATSFALNIPTTPFPLLSQGEHPTLGNPCWYFHPCQTETSVGEIMAEVHQIDWTEDQRLLRWLETWFMVISTVADLGT